MIQRYNGQEIDFRKVIVQSNSGVSEVFDEAEDD